MNIRIICNGKYDNPEISGFMFKFDGNKICIDNNCITINSKYDKIEVYELSDFDNYKTDIIFPTNNKDNEILCYYISGTSTAFFKTISLDIKNLDNFIDIYIC